MINIIKNFGLFFCKVICVLGIITITGWTIMEVSGAKVRFGSASLEDTLTGGVSIGSGRLYAWDSARISGVDLEDGQVKAPNGIGFSDPNSTFIDDDGVDLRYIVPNNGKHYLMAGGNEIATFDSNKFTFNKPVTYGSNAIGGYKEYIAILEQTGTSNPVATVLVNTTGTIVTPSRIDVGIYALTFSSAILTNNKTTVMIGNRISVVEAFYLTGAQRVSSTEINFTSATVGAFPTSGNTDEVFNGQVIQIQIYN